MTTGVPYFPQTLASNTVVGRLSANAGAVEAIPFGSLALALALNGTSTTSLGIGTGSKTLTTQTNLPISIGQLLLIASTASPSNFMTGQATAYAPTTGVLTVNVTGTGGSGTIAAWTISITGPQGSTGSAGAAGGLLIGVAGGTVDAITSTIATASTTDQQAVMVVCAGKNTSTTPTFKLNADALHTITTRGGQPLAVGDIGAAGFVAILEYNLANTRWELLNPATSLGSGLLTASGYTQSTAKILGRTTAGTGAVEELTAVAPLSMGGGNVSVNVASKADQQTGTGNTMCVTPLHQQDHDSACKAWAEFNNAGAINASYNVTSISKPGTGLFTPALTTVFSSTTYCVVPNSLDGQNNNFGCHIDSGVGLAAGSFRITNVNMASTANVDPTTGLFFQAFGRQ